MRTRLLLALAATLTLTSAAVAAGQEPEYPDMTGVWTGPTEAVIMGDPLHYDPAGDEPTIASVELTLSIDGQDGRRIWGTVASANGDIEPFLAVLHDGGTRYMGVDSDGYMDGRLVAENEIEHCYRHTTDSMIAVCTVMTR